MRLCKHQRLIWTLYFSTFSMWFLACSNPRALTDLQAIGDTDTDMDTDTDTDGDTDTDTDTDTDAVTDADTGTDTDTDTSTGSASDSEDSESETVVEEDTEAPIIAEKVNALLGTMSLEQKVGQMVQGSTGGASPDDVSWWMLGSVLAGGNDGPNSGVDGFSEFAPQSWAAFTDSYQDAALSSGANIPLLFGIDAVHGHAKMQGATIIPHNIGLGATRDPELVEQLGAVTAKEMAASGCHWTFAPTLAVVRDDRWGRSYESFGEHPELATMMTAYISGLQGALGDAGTVLATAKHYVGDGGTVWGTSALSSGNDQGDAVMDEDTFRAIHLKPYYSAIARRVGSVMPSYSSFNGEKMHGSRYWITDVLKGELGFDGFVISDWDAFFQLEAPGDELSYNEVVTSANAGIDMFMASFAYREVIGFLIDAVNNNEVSMDRIDDAVRRILTVKHRMHLFEHPRSQSQYLGDIYSAGHRALARQAARESLVLLKNEESLLPLSPDATVCLNGSGADNMAAQTGGWTLGWTEPLMEVQGVTIAEALNDYLQDKSGSVVDSGCDVGIRVVTETPATYAEYYGDSADPIHDDSGSCDAASGCVVVVLGGRPLDIEGVISDSASKAVVMGWYPGSEGGSGIVDVLYGVDGANFTGKLPVTWKIDTWDSPMNYCEADQCGDSGDHYSDSANPSDGVLFPYGFGLSF